MTPASDFTTDFAPLFDPPLQPVDVVRDLSVEDFERCYRRPRKPVIVEGATADWPALTRWTDPHYLAERAGHRKVYVRDLAAGSIDIDAYREVYRESSFADVVEQMFSESPPAWYLTQALVARGTGVSALLRRNVSPAWLPELADDLPRPAFWRDANLTECNLWMGPGGQSSSLHYDEFDNLNCAILGCKRWILFPWDQTPLLLNRDRGRHTIARGFHAAEADRWSGGRADAQGYQAVLQPGQLLFVPAGMWHQVFSGPGPSIAANFWYLRLPRDARSAVLYARRYSGFPARKRFPLALALVYAQFLLKLMQYGMGKRATGEVRIGPDIYGM